MRVDPRSGAVTRADGRRVDDRYVVADSSFEPDGKALARDRGWGITLWRVTPPLISAVRVDGLYPNDTWSGRDVTWIRRRCRPGRLLVSVSSDPTLFSRPQTIVARASSGAVARVRVQPTGIAVVRIPVSPSRATGRCRRERLLRSSGPGAPIA